MGNASTPFLPGLNLETERRDKEGTEWRLTGSLRPPDGSPGSFR
jgi:hypothetical protein